MPTWTPMKTMDFVKVLNESEALMKEWQAIRVQRGLHPMAMPMAAAALIVAYCKHFDGDPVWFAKLITTGDIAAFLKGPQP